MSKVLEYVASTTLAEPLLWMNSTLLSGDVADAVAQLKAQAGNDIVILGSGALIETLARRNLIDEYMVIIHPVILGAGRRLFPEGSNFTPLRLVDSKVTTTGVIIAIYQPADPA